MAPEAHAIDPAFRQAGQWVVVYSDPAERSSSRLVSIGRGLFGGQSPRANLDQLARRDLLSQLQEVLKLGKPVTREVTHRGHRWQVHAEPVLGPSGRVLAALGHYVPSGQAPEPAPVLGGWHYDIAQLQPWWAPELFPLYGFATPDGDGPLKAPDSFRLVEQGGWTRMRAALNRFTTAEPGELNSVVFRVPRADTGEQQKLVIFCHTERDQDGMPVVMHGITMRVGDFEIEEDDRFAEQDFLSGVLRLTSDTLCVVDLGHGRFYTPNHPWARLGIDMPVGARLAEAVHPEDLPELEELLQDVLGGEGHPTTGMVRFRAFGPGGWTRLQVTALRIHRATGHGHSLDHVLCRLAHPPGWS